LIILCIDCGFIGKKGKVMKYAIQSIQENLFGMNDLKALDEYTIVPQPFTLTL